MTHREVVAIFLLAGVSFVLGFGLAETLTDLFEILQRFDFGV